MENTVQNENFHNFIKRRF